MYKNRNKGKNNKKKEGVIWIKKKLKIQQKIYLN